MKILAAVLLAFAPLAGVARADVLHVPGEFPTVAEALDAAQAGDTVVLAGGTYDELIELNGLVDIVLRGQGKVILIGDGSAEPPLRVTLCNNVRVEHLTAQGSQGDAVVLSECVATTLRNVRVIDAGDAGIVVGQGSDNVVDHCRVDGSAAEGIALVQEATTTVFRCTVTGTGGAGISVSDATACVVDRCHVSGAAQQGIVMGKPVAVTACVARKNIVDLDGIAFGIDALGANNVVDGNRVVGCSGLRLEVGSTGGHVQGNKIIDCDRGILSFPANVLIQDNRAVKPFGRGFECEGAGSVLIGNRALHAGTNGFRLFNSMTAGSVVACKALHSGEDGFLVECDDVMFTDNTSKGSDAHGFLVEGTGNVFVGNTAHGNAGGSLQDEAGGNTYFENDFDP